MLSEQQHLIFMAMTENPENGKQVDVLLLPPPAIKSGKTLETVLRSRRSRRRYSSRPLSLVDLATLLWSAQGVTGSQGKRTAPSAYACHSLVLLLAAERVEGVPRGLYRYVPSEASGGHQLHLEDGSFQLASLADDALDLREIHQPAALILFTCDPELAHREDGTSTAEWAPIDAAMAMENLLLQATALDLGAVPMADLNPELLARQTDPSLISLFAVPVGYPELQNG
ncbi:MAG: nitroreductase family protein [bacterium]